MSNRAIDEGMEMAATGIGPGGYWQQLSVEEDQLLQT
jgi:hypothetical protein